MVESQIEQLRAKLNELIEKGADFSEIHETSMLLDECLVDYYNHKMEKK